MQKHYGATKQHLHSKMNWHEWEGWVSGLTVCPVMAPWFSFVTGGAASV